MLSGRDGGCLLDQILGDAPPPVQPPGMFAAMGNIMWGDLMWMVGIRKEEDPRTQSFIAHSDGSDQMKSRLMGPANLLVRGERGLGRGLLAFDYNLITSGG